MRNSIQRALACLASHAYQRRYIVEATAHQYVLPDEMLDSACSLLDVTLKSELLSRSLSERERQCLAEALTRFRDLQNRIPFADAAVSTEDLIERDADWLAVRAIATECLKTMGCEAERWD